MAEQLAPKGEPSSSVFCFSRGRRHTGWPRDWSSDVCSSDLDLSNVRFERARKSRAIHAGSAEIYVAQSGAFETHVRKVAPEEFHAAGLRSGQVRPRKNRFRHVRVPQIRVSQISSGKVRSWKFCCPQVRSFQTRVAQNRTTQIH